MPARRFASALPNNLRASELPARRSAGALPHNCVRFNCQRVNLQRDRERKREKEGERGRKREKERKKERKREKKREKEKAREREKKINMIVYDCILYRRILALWHLNLCNCYLFPWRTMCGDPPQVLLLFYCFILCPFLSLSFWIDYITSACILLFMNFMIFMIFMIFHDFS